MPTPTLVQSVHTGMDMQAFGSAIASTLQVTLPNLSLANNLLVFSFQYDSFASVVSVTDDQGNTWVNFSSTTNGATGDTFDIWYKAGATAGTRIVTATLSTASNNLSGNLSEWYNVATTTPTDLGVATGAAGNSAGHYTAGSFTTTVDGDLILVYGYSFAGGGAYQSLSNITAGTAGSGFTRLACDVQAGAQTGAPTFAEYQVQVTHGALNPDFTCVGNTTDIYGVAAVAFKAAAAGTAPTITPRIQCVQHQYLGSNGSVNGPSKIQFACPAGTGNLLVGCYNTDIALVASITDNKSNTWTFPSACAGTFVQIFYAKNATTDPTLGALTFTYVGIETGNPFVTLYSLVGCDTDTPFGVGSTDSGTHTTHTPLTAGSITPTTLGGIVFAHLAVEANDVTGVTVSGQTVVLDSVINASLANGVDAGTTSSSSLDEDNGYAHVANSTLAPMTFVWTGTGPSATYPGFGIWQAAVAMFEIVPPKGPSTAPIFCYPSQ